MSGSEPSDSEPPGPDRIRTRREFADALTRLREQADLTVRQVAGKADVQRGHSTVGDWFAGAGLPSASSVDTFVKVLKACGVGDPDVVEEWLRAWRRVRRPPGPRTESAEPYRGLAAFQPEEAEWFFGRTELTADLIHRVAALAAHGRGGVQLVVGASGTGKSSLLRAGLVPALRTGEVPGLHGCRMSLFSPGSDPLGELARQKQALTRARTDPGAAAGRSVLVVDQFEEVFTACADFRQQRLFVTELWSLARGAARVVVVIGLRADFYAQALLHPELLESLRSGQCTVGPMDEHGLREVIVAPARKARADLEDGLVDLVLREALPRGVAGPGGGETGVLPLLSHALYATWHEGRPGRLTVADYRRCGGLDGAVAATAERVFATLTDPQREVARHLFLELVRIAPDAADTRRWVATAELLARSRPVGDTGEASPSSSASAELDDVLDRFVEGRLITADRGSVAISHEALLTAWPRLREWLDFDREGLLIGRQLAEAGAAWIRARRDPATLYRGVQLAAALEWATGRTGELPWSVREFLEAGSRYARRHVRRLRQLVAVLAVLLLVAVSSTAVAFRLERTAALQRDRALSQNLAAEATTLRSADPNLAAQLSLAAYRIAPTSAARGSLLSAFATPYASVLPMPDSAYAVVFAPRTRLFAAVGRDGTARLWDATDAHRPRALTVFRTRHVGNPAHGAVVSAAFSPNGRVFATASWDGTAKLWDVSRPRRPVVLGVLRGHSRPVLSVAFSRDGATVATGSQDATVRLWNVRDTGRPLPVAVIRSPAGAVDSVAFSSSSPTLATGGAGGARLWDVTRPGRPRALAPLARHAGLVRSVAFSPDGHTLATGDDNTTAQLWDITRPRRPTALATLTGHTAAVFTVAFSHDGRRLATGADDSTTRLWDVTRPRRPVRLATLTGHTNTVLSAGFSPDGHTLATGSDDYSVRLWDISRPSYTDYGSPLLSEAVQPGGHILATGDAGGKVTLWRVSGAGLLRLVDTSGRAAGPVLSLAFDVDGRTLAAVGGNHQVRLWDVRDPRRPRPLGSVPGFSAAFGGGGGGRVLATSSVNRVVRLWDLTGGPRPTPLATLSGHTNVVSCEAFSPDGRLLATAGEDHTVRLWDVADPRHPRPLLTLGGHTNVVVSLAFSPDGRTLATASWDRTVRLWDLSDRGRPGTSVSLTGHTDRVTSVAFAPDGRTLATAAWDHTVRLWNVVDPRHPTGPTALTGHTGAVTGVSFGADAGTVFSVSTDGVIRLWDTDATRIARRVCSVAHPLITRREWTEHAPGAPYRPPCRHPAERGRSSSFLLRSPIP
jgi:WD40 repeat protein